MKQFPALYAAQTENEVRERKPPSASDELYLFIKETIRDMREEKVNISIRNLQARLSGADQNPPL